MEGPDSDVSSGIVRFAIELDRSTSKIHNQKCKIKSNKRDKLKLKKTKKMKLKLKDSEKKIRASNKPSRNDCVPSAERQSPRTKQEHELYQPTLLPDNCSGKIEEENELQMVAVTDQTRKQAQRGPCILRIWSREHEIEILKGLIEIKNAGGVLSSDIFKLMQGKLDIDFSETQIKSKVKSMRRKFMGKIRSAASSLGSDLDLFQLSYKLWGETSSSSFFPNSFLDSFSMLHGKSGSNDILEAPILVIREGYKLLSDSTREELEEEGRKIESQKQKLRNASDELFNTMSELTVKALKTNQ